MNYCHNCRNYSLWSVHNDCYTPDNWLRRQMSGGHSQAQYIWPYSKVSLLFMAY